MDLIWMFLICPKHPNMYILNIFLKHYCLGRFVIKMQTEKRE